MVGIIDYNAGNITSVERALKSLNISFILSKNPQNLADCDKIIFPGVGEANYAMTQLKALGFDKFILNCKKKNIPILGICLGSHIIFDFSQEGSTKCLGLLKGQIKYLYSIDKNLKQKGFKVPHMGWNNLEIKKNCAILKDVPQNSDFYFVHSYVICPENDDVTVAVADYGIKIPAVIQKENIFACQFHPEKSGNPGLKILQNFCNL